VHGLAIPLGNLALLSPRVFNSIRGLHSGTDKDDTTQGSAPNGELEHQPLLAETSV
jgi:hypothetical protein